MLDTIGFPVTTYVLFAFLVVTGIIIDLYSHKSNEVITIRDAGLWSIFWVAVSAVFGIYLYFAISPEMSSLFFAGYLLEKTLSVDNLFVFMAIFLGLQSGLGSRTTGIDSIVVSSITI